MEINQLHLILQKGKFGLFGHKRSKSETETEGFICPLDLALPLDKLKSSASLYQDKEVSSFTDYGLIFFHIKHLKIPTCKI